MRKKVMEGKRKSKRKGEKKNERKREREKEKEKGRKKRSRETALSFNFVTFAQLYIPLYLFVRRPRFT